MKTRLLILAALITTSLFDEALFPTLVLTTMLIPGFVVAERFLKDLSSFVKPAMYIFLSVVISTHLVYYLSLILGYSLFTIRISAIMLFLFILFARKPDFNREFWYGVAAYSVFFLFAFSILYHSLWYEKDSYIVLSGSNWQDTPYHYEIIESINSRNFPPQDPSFSGVPLRYHYFVDFHAALLEKPLGYYPRILLYLNSAFFPLLFFSVFLLTLVLTGSERTGVYSGFISVFGWGFTYLWLFSSILSGTYDPKQSYVMDYAGFFNLPPILDNLLQQRPLLIGLPGFVLSLSIFIRGVELRKKEHIFLSGIVTGMLLPFHVLATFSAFLFLAVYSLNAILGKDVLSKERLRDRVFQYAGIAYPFVISFLFFIPFLHFFGSARTGKPWFWEFGGWLKIMANLGIPFIFALLAPLIRVKGSGLPFLWMVSALVFIFLPSITPNTWDMYKFLLIAWIPISVLFSQFLTSLRGRARFAIPFLLLLSTLSVIPVILWNQTDYGCASMDEFETGLWIRNNTPENAVFLTWPSLHSPPTMIAGRLRILGYTNWPYGHGITIDQIWERFEDVKAAYSNTTELERVIDRYGIDYVYYGLDERINFKNSYEVLMSSDRLVPVFKKGGNVVFRVVK